MSAPFETLEHGDWVIEISRARHDDDDAWYYRCSWKRKPAGAMETLGGERCIVAKSRATVEILGKCGLEAVCDYLDGMTKEKR